MALLRRIFLSLFYLLAGVSLLILIGSLILWVRSFSVSEAIGMGKIVRPDAATVRLDDIRIWSAKGGVGIYFSQTWNPANTTQGWDWYHQTDTSMDYPYLVFAGPSVDQTRHEFGPFKYGQIRYHRRDLWMQIDNNPPVYLSERSVQTSLVFPYWSCAVISLPLPVLALRRLWRRRRSQLRLRRGLCSACGYDLRDSPERCPECGVPRQGDASADHV